MLALLLLSVMHPRTGSQLYWRCLQVIESPLKYQKDNN